MSESDSVIAGEIGRNFRRHDDVVDCESVLSMGESYFSYLRSEFAEFRDSRVYFFSHSFLDPVDEILFRNSDFHSFQVFSLPNGRTDSCRFPKTRGISRVVPCHDLIEKCGILDGFRESSRSVKRACHGDNPFSGIASVGGLESDHSAHTCRLTDRASRIGSECCRNHPGGNRSR